MVCNLTQEYHYLTLHSKDLMTLNSDPEQNRVAQLFGSCYGLYLDNLSIGEFILRLIELATSGGKERIRIADDNRRCHCALLKAIPKCTH
jgi:hypothetical protein